MGTVVIDANAIVKGSWHLDSAPWRLLRYRSRANIDRLVVPEIVVREVVGRYRVELSSTSDRARSLAADFRHLRLVHPSMPDIQVAGEAEGYERGLRRSLAADLVDVAGPPVSVLDLADRAIARRRPFNEKGAGFRDATIWEHVICEASRLDGGPVAFISNDGGFASEDGIHPDLQRDLAERAPNRAVQRYRTVDEYVRAVGVPDPALMAEVAELVEEESAQFGVNVCAAVEGMRWRSDYPRADIIVEAAYQPVTVRVIDVTVTDGAPEALVEFEVEVEAEIYVEPWDRSSDAPHISGSAILTMSGSVSYDLTLKELGNLVVSDPLFDLDHWLDR